MERHPEQTPAIEKERNPDPEQIPAIEEKPDPEENPEENPEQNPKPKPKPNPEENPKPNPSMPEAIVACKMGNLAELKRLVEESATPFSPDEADWLMVYSSRSMQCYEYLHKTFGVPREGKYAIHSTFKGSLEVIKLMMKHADEAEKAAATDPGTVKALETFTEKDQMSILAHEEYLSAKEAGDKDVTEKRVADGKASREMHTAENKAKALLHPNLFYKFRYRDHAVMAAMDRCRCAQNEAAEDEAIAVLQFLVEAGAQPRQYPHPDMDLRKKENEKPRPRWEWQNYVWYVGGSHPKVLKFFEDRRGETFEANLLFKGATMFANLNMVKFLDKHRKPDINHINLHGWTPMMELLVNEKCWRHRDEDVLEVLRYLIARGADPTIVDKDGEKPTEIARYEKLSEAVVELLQKWEEGLDE